MKTALTIAGSDSSGGAGIQADIKTMTANGVFATCAVTALTAQNTTGVTDILESTPHFLAEQLDAVFTDIVPDAVKIGMVSSAELIAVIAEKLRQYGAERVVVDPVMVATSGAKLLRDDAIQALTSQLLPLATVLTPNIPEAEILSGLTITDAAGMEAAARTISQRYGCAVLCKGGHQINDADDLLWRDGSGKWFRGKRIPNPNTHGTGCTLSSAELIAVIAEKLRQYGAERVVVDPVMVATSGAKLLRDDAIQALTSQLLPLATVLTPNIPEAEILSGLTITDAAGMEAAARTISQRYGCAVLCKGGHQINDADDLLWRDGSGKWFRGKRIPNPNTHGTGCTLSSAIAANLAKGYDLDRSVERAKAYISGALAAMLDLGRGSGPMNHMFDLKGGFAE